MERSMTFTCGECKVTKTHTEPHTTGYGIEPGTERKICYECCGKRDLADMLATGKATMYLSSEIGATGRTGHKVTNWPGTLLIPLSMAPKRGRHNVARYRYDVWFHFHGSMWHGVQYGDNTQICHVKRVKN